MYDELIKQLREDVPKALSNFDFVEDWIKVEGLIKEAADAIEELSAYVRQIEELRKDGYYLEKTKMMTYGQATMTMPLPEPPKEET